MTCPRCERTKGQTFYTKDSDGKDWWICMDCGKLYIPGERAGRSVSVYDDERYDMGRRGGIRHE